MSAVSLNNGWLLVVGHAGLLGKHFTEFALSQGKSIIGLDKNKIAVSDKFSEKILQFKVDLSDESTVNKVACEARRRGLQISGLLYLAARDAKISELNYGYNLHDQPHKEILDTFAVGTLGAFSTIRAFDSSFSDSTSIILVGSDLSLISPNQDLYCVCGSPSRAHQPSCRVKPVGYSLDKTAMIGLTRYLATFFAKDERDIRVNCLCIGAVDNNFNEEFRDKISRFIPMRRLAHIEEYNEVFLNYLENCPKYQTGSVIVVDGGRTIL